MKPISMILGNSRARRVDNPLLDAIEFNSRSGNLLCTFGRNEDGWEHVAVSPFGSKREKDQPCPTWAQMCEVKRLFFYDSEMALQLHPPERDYFHGPGFDTNILHLWRPVDGDWSRLEDKECVCQKPAKTDPYWDSFGRGETADGAEETSSGCYALHR